VAFFIKILRWLPNDNHGIYIHIEPPSTVQSSHNVSIYSMATMPAVLSHCYDCFYASSIELIIISL